jgi:two-component system, NtrC family, sensor histidine kinase HydH
MKLPLIYRILAPTLVVSTLLLAVGLTAAIYAYRWNERVSRLLDSRVGAVLTTQEMVLAIRDVRHVLTRYQLTKDPAYLELAKTSIDEAQEFAAQLLESPLEEDAKDLQETSQAIAEVERRINLSPAPTEVDTDSIRHLITREALAKSQALLDRRQEAVTHESRQNRLNADRIGRSLAILGFCGAGAGLLAGFGVARGISRSIQQLGGSVHSVAETIFQDGEPHLSPPEGIHDLLTTIGNIRQKTAGIMDELEQSREKATRSDQLAAVGQLAAGIAHELRNPLTAVKLLVDAAVELNAPLRGPELLVLQDEVAHMEQMTQSFLDFARPPKLARQSVELNQVVEQCLDLVRRRCEMLGIEVSLGAEPQVQVMGDAQQLRQVILNLLLNAIDAQPNGGRIAVRIAEDPESHECTIEITDNGSGIPQESHDRIFDPFVSTKETGMGLGLAISRRIVRSHGGEITALNSPDGGAVFRIQLPAVEITQGVVSV